MSCPAPPPLLPLLKQYFGFGSFRPFQERIIRDALAGRDVFGLPPTVAPPPNKSAPTIRSTAPQES